MYLFSRPTSREERGPSARSGRRRTRCFATSTIRERVENACYNFILLQVVAFSRLRASSRGHARSNAKRVHLHFRQLLPSCSLSPSAVASIRRIDRRNIYFVSILFQDRAVRCRRSIRGLFCVTWRNVCGGQGWPGNKTCSVCDAGVKARILASEDR